MRKKLWKTLLAVFTACCMLFAFAACGKDNEPVTPPGQGGEQTPPEQGGEQKPPQGGDEQKPPQGGDEPDENEGVIPEEEGTAGLLYKEYGESYSVWGLGTATASEIVIPSFHEGKPVSGIEKYAFWRCTFTGVTVGKGMTAIADGAFKDCYKLETVTVPNSVTAIGAEVFSGCSKLESVAIPRSVTSIGNNAFLNCLNLKNILIPSGVTEIAQDVFRGCRSLASIAVEEGNSVYHSAENCLIETAAKRLMLGCKNSVIPADGSVTTIGTGAFYLLIGFTDTASIEMSIPNGVTTIEAEAFSGCTAFTGIIIPRSVTRIGAGAFRGCGRLESIAVEEGNTAYYVEGDCLIERATKTLLLGCASSEIPADVVIIGDSAFEGCTALEEITIPNSVKAIGSSAFDGCGAPLRVVFLGTRDEWNVIMRGDRWDGDGNGTQIIWTEESE